MKKSAPCILHLDALYLDAWRSDGGHFRRQARFAADAAGQASFRAYLGECRRDTFYLLVDLADEDFIQAELPPVRGGDRRALLERKLAQLFPNTRFLLAASQGKNSAGRRDEKFLFSALTRPHAIDPWLDAMAAENIALAGAYSSSQLTGRFAGMRQAGCRILVTLGKSGLRQSCHLNGRLIFSRLVPAAGSLLSENIVIIAGEAEKIRQYLVGQRLIQRDEHIRIACLASAHRLLDTGSQFDLASDFSCEHILLPAQDEDDVLASDAAFVEMLANRPPVGQYLPAALRQTHRERQAKAALVKICLVTLAGALALVVAALVAAHRYQADYALAHQAGQAAKQRHQALLATLPETNEKPETVQTIAIASASLMQRAPAIDDLLIDISKALDAMPQIDLHSIDWKVGEGAPEKSPGHIMAELGLQAPDTESAALMLERLAALPEIRASMLTPPGELTDGGSTGTFRVRLERPASP